MVMFLHSLKQYSCVFRAAHGTRCIHSTIPVQAKRLRKDVTDCGHALTSMDASYPAIYGEEWPCIRLALLCKKKQAALMNNFSPDFEENMVKFKNLGCIDVRKTYERNVKNVRRTKTEEAQQEKTSDAEESRLNNAQSFQSLETDDLETDATSFYPERYRKSEPKITSTVPTSDRLILPTPGVDEGDIPVLQDFVPVSSMMGIGATSVEEDVYAKFRSNLQSERGATNEVQLVEEPLEWPEQLNVMARPRTVITDFPKPSRSFDLFDHYAMDAASLLPVIMLGMRKDDAVLDMCAAPGGKTLAILQTLLPGMLQSNDRNHGRVNRLKNVMSQFIMEDSRATKNHYISETDGRLLTTYGTFDRVLCDVPCSADRHSLENASNNIYRPSRLRERLSIPELQSELLINAVKQARIGGTIVYSTCTLSPIQNDGVVFLALNKLRDYSGVNCKVVTYSSAALEPLDFLYKMRGRDMGIKYGHMVMPFLPNNYGPMYITKLVRTS